MGKVYKKVCKDCGRRFETESSNKRLCPDCVEGRLAERVQKTRQGYKKPEAIRKKVNVDSGSVKKETPKKWDMRKCKKCFYGAKLDGKDQICDYITITGHMRPCDPGAECIKFLPKGSERKKRKLTIPFAKDANIAIAGYSGYVQDSIYRTEKRRRNRYR